MFSRILVANRGEIACRIVRTARRMGIATVAVYSEADRGALHVEAADAAIAIGPAAAAASYLNIGRIVEAAVQSGAEAVHPGYGFLSENADFARALEAAGIAFIGPSPEAIEAMGDKIASKKLAVSTGVATVPGHLGVVADAGHAARIASEIGYPVMLKASAGGGGKGMRVVDGEAGLAEAFERAASEARNAFGDDRLFLEKFIEEPRHIEIQVLADAYGNCIHLGERECSIQRRNQKILEEAPSCFLDPETRAAMGAQAVALAKAVSYRSAGTVEFVIDRDRNFFFLEMNTRLQVEHPVTELVTGVDLVEEMILIAAGEPLRLKQEDVRLDGWAVEARIYAEDPLRDFLPSVGRLTRYRPPAAGLESGRTIRIDSGVAEGSEISLFYDPMIAKLCTHAPSRALAIDALADGLDTFALDGIRHNIALLSALMAHPRWREGRLSTAFIAEEFPEGFRGAVPDAGEVTVLAAVAVTAELLSMRPPRNDARGSIMKSLPEHWVLSIDRESLPVKVSGTGGAMSAFVLDFGDRGRVEVETDWRPGELLWRGKVGERQALAQVRREGHALRLSRRGATALARLLTTRAAQLAALMPEKNESDSGKLLKCPMPGLVVSIAVAPGQRVAAGETLAVVEAMKMENVLRAERAATIAGVLVKPGDSLAVDTVILEFE